MLSLLTKFRKEPLKGQTTVEFALVAILFLGLVFVILDIAMLFFVNLTMQHAVREGTRYAVTGQGYSDWRTAISAKIREQSMNLYDRNLNIPKEPQIKIINQANVTFSNYTGGTTYTGTTGVPLQTIVVSLTYKWRLLTPFLRPVFPGGIYTFTVRSTMKTEPFPAP
jgi:Flp pilus assembly protein TadG